MVRDVPASEDLLLFTPGLNDSDLHVEDGAFQLGSDRHLIIIVANTGREPIKLKKGMRLGGLQSVTEITSDDVPKEHEYRGAVSALSAEGVSERRKRLLTQLQLELEHVGPIRTQELTQLLLSYEDLFALDSSELGTTHIVSTPVTTLPFGSRLGEHRWLCKANCLCQPNFTTSRKELRYHGTGGSWSCMGGETLLIRPYLHVWP